MANKRDETLDVGAQTLNRFGRDAFWPAIDKYFLSNPLCRRVVRYQLNSVATIAQRHDF